MDNKDHEMLPEDQQLTAEAEQDEAAALQEDSESAARNAEEEAPAEAAEEPAEEAAEEPTEEAEAAPESEETGESQLDYPEEEKPVKGPRALAWLAALFVMAVGLVSLIPAGLNGMLGTLAVQGLIYEALGMQLSAYSTYEQLSNSEMNATEFADQNFSFTDREVPGISIGNFRLSRITRINYKLYGPVTLSENQLFAQYGESRVPRYLQQEQAETTIIDEIFNLFYEQMNSEEAAGMEYPELLEMARAADPKSEERKLYYDALVLMTSSAEALHTEEAKAKLAALKAEPNSARWMYSDIEFYLATEAQEYDKLIVLCDERLAVYKEDISAMEYQVKSMYLSGKEDEAFRLAENYRDSYDIAADYMNLVMADLRIRSKEYDSAISLCNTLVEELDLNTESGGNLAMEASALHAVALLLQGNPDEAYTLLRGILDAPYGSSTNNYIAAIFAAAIESKNAEYLQELFALSGMDETTMPQVLIDLQAGETTVEEIFTVGWGGAAL